MGNLGFPELLVIMVVVLLVFGPGKLPEIGSSLGRAISEFKKGFQETPAKPEQKGDSSAGSESGEKHS